MILLDTSFVYALADRGDPNHERAREIFQTVQEKREPLLLHNYVILESVALLQNRLGMDPALRFLRESTRFKHHWITPDLHREAVEQLKEKNSRAVSLVDCVSFTVMEKLKLEKALAFDADFEAEGFILIA